jgi:hypothetical protein
MKVNILRGKVPICAANETVRIPHIYSTNFVLGTRWRQEAVGTRL